MFTSGGLVVLLTLALLLAVGLLVFSRRLSWFGRLPGDIRYEGRRTRVYAPLGTMLLLSLVLSLVLSLLSTIF
ncbi:MAG TPA: DUF2905 domain-containing protein [Pyrinomonadaceae bacterium]|nr:DUF2905 domain-containing protein [Pyrinomonadaceae bacterium]